MQPNLRPRLRGAKPSQLAAAVAKGPKARPTLRRDGVAHKLALPASAAPVLAMIDGRRTLGDIAAARKLDWLSFAASFSPVEKALHGWGMLYYSNTFA
jgi:hypothetical protein